MHARTEQPRLLLIETSGRVGYVAVAFGNDLGDVHVLDESRRHGRDLAPAVAAACAARGWRPRELDAVLVSRGPGSYTGLRVGIMSAKTFAYATGCVILGIETFAVIAEQAPPETGRLDIVADAQQQNLYVQSWQRDEARVWRPMAALAIVPASRWLAGLEPEVWVSGPGLKICEDRIPTRNSRVEQARREPKPASLLALGLRRWHAGEADDLWTMEPLYLRASNAEENWDKRAGDKK